MEGFPFKGSGEWGQPLSAVEERKSSGICQIVGAHWTWDDETDFPWLTSLLRRDLTAKP
jgi:hypothetical protein